MAYELRFIFYDDGEDVQLMKELSFKEQIT